jgi:hypothetical protein
MAVSDGGGMHWSCNHARRLRHSTFGNNFSSYDLEQSQPFLARFTKIWFSEKLALS